MINGCGTAWDTMGYDTTHREDEPVRVDGRLAEGATSLRKEGVIVQDRP